MRLLIITQAVDKDSSTLGFFVEWIREFSRRCESVDVIALSVGAHDLPENVRVFPLAARPGLIGKLRRLLEYRRLLRRLLPSCDGVFAHMCPEYVIAGWPIFGLRKKKVMLWYAHRSVTTRLRLACRLATRVLSISPGSIGVQSPKTRFLGHGIPTETFSPETSKAREKMMLSVGRLTPIKRIELLIRALAEMRRQGAEVRLALVGETVLHGDSAYLKGLHELCRELRVERMVDFVGAVPYAKLPAIYRQAALHLNAAPKGALDKSVLEAMACGTPVVVTNPSFADVLGADAGRLLATENPADIAQKSITILQHADPTLTSRLRRVVEVGYSLRELVRGILETYDTIS